jgi:hypothetical protein
MYHLMQYLTKYQIVSFLTLQWVCDSCPDFGDECPSRATCPFGDVESDDEPKKRGPKPGSKKAAGKKPAGKKAAPKKAAGKKAAPKKAAVKKAVVKKAVGKRRRDDDDDDDDDESDGSYDE